MSFLISDQKNHFPSLPLPLYTSHVLADAQIDPFGQCHIIVGLSMRTIEQLCTLSADQTDAALAQTNDQTRFASVESTETWYAKGRTVFALQHATSQNLMAVVWIGPKPLELSIHHPFDTIQTNNLPTSSTEDTWDTLSYRSYPPYRGKGFMTDFVRYILTIYQAEYPNRRLWIGVNRSNTASLTLAKKLSFTTVNTTKVDSTRILLILDSSL